MGIQDRPNIRDQFDSITYAEIQPYHWIAGSSHHWRTQPVRGSAENSNDWVHLAITWDASVQRTTIYRNGVPYGSAYNKNLYRFVRNDAEIYFGKRHGTCTGRAPDSVSLDCASFYTSALSQSDVKESFDLGCCGHSAKLGKTAIGCCKPNEYFSDNTCQSHLQCPAGMYETKPATSSTNRECAACDAGTYTSNTNSKTCKPCEAGFYCPGNTTRRACEAGTYTNQQSQSKCTPCGPDGHSQSGATSCNGIQQGYYGIGGTDDQHTGSKMCEPGYFCPGGATNRQPCDQETFQDKPGKDSCNPWTTCIAGEYVSVDGTTTSDRECEGCGDEEFTNLQNMPKCQPLQVCNPGSWMAEDSDDGTQDRVCAACSKGQYTNVSNSRQCVAYSICPDGQWAPDPLPSSDRDCRPWQTCGPGQIQSAKGTKSSDVVCAVHNNTSCGLNQYQHYDGVQHVCRAVTTCRTGQFELAPPTLSSNRICDRITQCAENEIEVKAPTLSSDRVCKELCRPCGVGTFESESCDLKTKTPNVCTTCTSCGTDRLIASPCTSTSDRSCQDVKVVDNDAPQSSPGAPFLESTRSGNMYAVTKKGAGVFVDSIDVGSTLQHLLNSNLEMRDALQRSNSIIESLQQRLRQAEVRLSILEG